MKVDIQSKTVSRVGLNREGRAKRLGIDAGDYIPVPESGCWLWMGPISSHGYGKIGKSYAHRVSYERYRGPIPSELQIDHLCRVRCCVNPDHLEVVTANENKARGVSPAAVHARKTHCIKGHPFDEHNTWYRTMKNGKKSRQCRICRYLAFRKWRNSHA